ncbi:hypothetical protein Droror1_Dr00021097 [Drosera rotundifolia]
MFRSKLGSLPTKDIEGVVFLLDLVGAVRGVVTLQFGFYLVDESLVLIRGDLVQASLCGIDESLLAEKKESGGGSIGVLFVLHLVIAWFRGNDDDGSPFVSAAGCLESTGSRLGRAGMCHGVEKHRRVVYGVASAAASSLGAAEWDTKEIRVHILIDDVLDDSLSQGETLVLILGILLAAGLQIFLRLE